MSTNSLLFETLADRCSSHCYLWWTTAQHTWPNRFIHPFTHIHTVLSFCLKWDFMVLRTWIPLNFSSFLFFSFPNTNRKAQSSFRAYSISDLCFCVYIYICSRNVSDDDDSICPFSFQFYSTGHSLNSLPTPKCQRQNNRMGNALLWKKNGKQWQLLWAAVHIHLKGESFIQLQQIAIKVGI